MSATIIIFIAVTVQRSGGGVARSIPQLASEVAKCGLETHLIYFDFGDENTLEGLSENLMTHPISRRGGTPMDIKNGKVLKAVLSKILDALDSKTILLHHGGIWTSANHSVCEIARRRNLPLICSPRGMFDPWSLQQSALKKKVAWHLYAQKDLESVTLFHATSEMEAGYIRGLGFKQPICIVPNGVNLPEHPRSLESGTYKPLMRRALFLSRIHPKKGLLRLLKAWDQVRPSNWELIISGNDDSNFLPLVQTEILRRGLQETVQYVGPKFGDEKEKLFKSSELFILPTETENFGIVIAEALSYGLPVITTRGAPWAELEGRIFGKSGWWVENTTEGITNGIRNACGTPQAELHLMGLEGRRLIEDKYTWGTVANEMTSAYRKLIDSPESLLNG